MAESSSSEVKMMSPEEPPRRSLLFEEKQGSSKLLRLQKQPPRKQFRGLQINSDPIEKTPSGSASRSSDDEESSEGVAAAAAAAAAVEGSSSAASSSSAQPQQPVSSSSQRPKQKKHTAPPRRTHSDQVDSNPNSPTHGRSSSIFSKLSASLSAPAQESPRHHRRARSAAFGNGGRHVVFEDEYASLPQEEQQQILLLQRKSSSAAAAIPVSSPTSPQPHRRKSSLKETSKAQASIEAKAIALKELKQKRCIEKVKYASRLPQMMLMYKYDRHKNKTKRYFYISEDGTELRWSKNPALALNGASSSAAAAAAAASSASGNSRGSISVSASAVVSSPMSWGSSSSSGSCKSILLASVQKIVVGPRTGPFKKYSWSKGYPWLCFSLVTDIRSIDIECTSLAQFKVWFFGLQALTPLSHKHVSEGKLLWIRAILKTIQVSMNHEKLNVYEVWRELVTHAQQCVVAEKNKMPMPRPTLECKLFFNMDPSEEAKGKK